MNNYNYVENDYVKIIFLPHRGYIYISYQVQNMTAKQRLLSLLLPLFLLGHFGLLASGLPGLPHKGKQRVASVTRSAKAPVHSIELVLSFNKLLGDHQLYENDSRYKGAMVGTATAATYSVSRVLQGLYPSASMQISVPGVEPLEEDTQAQDSHAAAGNSRWPPPGTKAFVARLNLNGLDSLAQVLELVDLINTASAVKSHPHWHELSRAISEVTPHFGLGHLSAAIFDPSAPPARLQNGTAHRRLITGTSYSRLTGSFDYFIEAWRYTSEVYTAYQHVGPLIKAGENLSPLQKLTLIANQIINPKTSEEIGETATAIRDGAAAATSAARNAAMAAPFLLATSVINVAAVALTITSSVLSFFVEDPTQVKLDYIIKTVQQVYTHLHIITCWLETGTKECSCPVLTPLSVCTYELTDKCHCH